MKVPRLPVAQLRGLLQRFLPLVFTVVFGLVALVLTRQLIAKERRQLAAERARLLENYRDPVDVVVAAKDLSPGTVIDASMLTYAKIPERFLQPYSVRTPNEIMGLVTGAPIAKEEQVLLNKLRSPDQAPQDATLSSQMPQGTRAITIAVDSLTGVNGFVRPGDKIDILWTIQLPGADGQQQAVTRTLFQDIPVLAMGASMNPGEEQPAGGQYAVTLALDPQQTSFLLFAREQGRIQLSLRSHKESGAVAVAPANINTLMEAVLGRQEAPPAPREPRHVEVYKGLNRDVVVIADEVSVAKKQ